MRCFLVSFVIVLVLFLLGIVVEGFSISSVRTERIKRTCQCSALCAALEVDATSEVVGFDDSTSTTYTRIASLLLSENGAIAVPRGVAPGCLTEQQDSISPIFVSLPSKDWKTTHGITLPHRQSDLVWVIIGTSRKQHPTQLLRSWQRNATVVLLMDVEINTDDFAPSLLESSPTTYVYGKHVVAMQAILAKRRIRKVSQVESWAEICRLVAGTDQVKSDNDSDDSAPSNNNIKLVSIPAIDLVCAATPTETNESNNVSSAIVVGAGIIGSSISRALTQRGIQNITVYDPTPTGTTTPASWAWLNANSKPPQHYKSLNQLGLRGWRSDALLQKLPSLKWGGTLIQTKKQLNLTGGYTAEGPLTKERIQELEPEANFTSAEEAYVYHFADEGHVNPQEAVLALRQEAMAKGVSFIKDKTVVGLVRNSNDRVIGVKTASLDGSLKEQLADVVIVAAGANSSKTELGGVNLVHNPSMTYFSDPLSSSPASFPTLNKTLVDMVSSLYLAQRKDGTIVAGGGSLKPKHIDTLGPATEIQEQVTVAQNVAQRLAPNPVGNSPLTRQNKVVSKPMPKDGFPILGFLEPGLYSAVTHSGMTLSPLIGQLVAAEVKLGVSLSLLDDYRPSRFAEMETDSSPLKDWQESKSESSSTKQKSVV